MKPPPRCRDCEQQPWICEGCHFYRCACRGGDGRQHYRRDGSRVTYYAGGSTRDEVREYRELVKADGNRVVTERTPARFQSERLLNGRAAGLRA